MSPIPLLNDVLHAWVRREEVDNPEDRPSNPDGLVLEAWGECNLLKMASTYAIRELTSYIRGL